MIILIPHQAEDSCSDKGGHLASIHGENYNQWITALFNDASRKSTSEDWEGFWVGKGWGWGWGKVRIGFGLACERAELVH